MSLYVINRTFTNAAGQPLPNLSIAILVGKLNGSSGNADTSTQPGSPLATIHADPDGVTLLSNPTTPGTNTVTTDGLGNLCSVVNGVTTLGVYINTSGYEASIYAVIQAYGPGIVGVDNQFLIPCSFPSGGGGGT